MERAVAIKKLGKILGRNLGYQVNPNASTAEERALALGEAKALSTAHDAAKQAEDARRKAILEGDAEYQRLRAEREQLREAQDRAFSRSRSYKITVGTTTSMFFRVEAEGDSWEEVISKLTKEKVAA